ncbi:hypothetical protein PISL3812_04691 [Talaromyces islandicus]|uniref:Uncharacterized protein n=1 Tax=Talaromyces islandicus TaxID=28573 RepID=A0A0U1LY79_TALIS|nr:hypothetical protein PISL3812_04691 [Talaromyces islandicus]
MATAHKHAQMVDFYLKGNNRQTTGIWDLPVELIRMIAKDLDNRALCRFASVSQRHWRIFRSICHEKALGEEGLLKDNEAKFEGEKSEDNYIPLFNKAVLRGNQGAVRSFLDHGVNPNSNYIHLPRLRISISALNQAMYLRDPFDMCKLLLSYGADPCLENIWDDRIIGYTPSRAPIQQAARAGNSKLVCLFLKYGAKPLARDGIYHDFFRKCDVTVVRQLFQIGLNLDDRFNLCRGGYFYDAAGNENGRDVLDFLASVDIECLSREINRYDSLLGRTLLSEAIESRRQDNVQAVLVYGGDPNFCHEGSSVSPLIRACTYNQETAVQALIQAGADVHFRGENSAQAIHYAVQVSARITEIVLKAGADIRSVTRLGNTPLHVACMPGQFNDRYRPENEGYLDVVQLLLAWGAPIHVLNSNGLTPMDVAANCYRYSFIEAMKKARSIG